MMPPFAGKKASHHFLFFRVYTSKFYQQFNLVSEPTPCRPVTTMQIIQECIKTEAARVNCVDLLVSEVIAQRRRLSLTRTNIVLVNLVNI